MNNDIATRVISSLVRFSSALRDDMLEVFFVAGVIAITVGASIEFGRPVGLVVLGALLLLPVVNKLR